MHEQTVAGAGLSLPRNDERQLQLVATWPKRTRPRFKICLSGLLGFKLKLAHNACVRLSSETDTDFPPMSASDLK